MCTLGTKSGTYTSVKFCYHIFYQSKHTYLENDPKQISALIGLKPCFYYAIRARDFYRMIVEEGE